MSSAQIAANRGKDRQRWAQDAFEDGRFREAYDLYVEAESLFREAINGGVWQMATRLYFTQCTAVRCLEELIEETPALFPTYRSSAKQFLREWPTHRIKNEIQRDHVSEAILFRSLREIYLKGSHEFAIASATAKEGDEEKAKAILNNLIQRIKDNDDDEVDALRTIARSKIEKLRAHQELRKPKEARDLHILASSYLRAARVSRLPANSRSTQRKRISAFRASFLSNALKFRAFQLLNQMCVPEASLAKAARYLGNAARCAEKAHSLLPDFSKTHARYLQYFHQVLVSRLHLLAFMSRGDLEDYNAAVLAWEKSLHAMEQLCKNTDEERFFPNRFYSLSDLRLERDFLAAARAFREKRWAECASLLDGWRKNLPPECIWSWRDVQVQIRLLGAQAIAAIESADSDGYQHLCRSLIDLSKSEPSGGAARYFATEIAGLREKAKNSTLFGLTVESLAMYFPLDSRVDDVQAADDIDYFASLPERIYQAIAITTPITEADLEGAKLRVASAVEAFLGYLCDYYGQMSAPTHDVPEHDVQRLIAQCGRTQLAGQPKFKAPFSLLCKAIDQLLSATENETFQAPYGIVCGALQKLMYFFPVIVELRSTVLRSEPPTALEAFPNWRVDRAGRRVLYVFADTIQLEALRPGQYYMRPGWRKANRPSYRLDENRKLLPVRFVPRWDYWETEVAYASTLMAEGVLLKHVRMAIELSKLCKDSAEKPKVGAVIVKNGIAIAQAYRGEDGSDRHAEEIAIGKCTRDQLRGAIMITTLEPCTEHGRSTNAVSCATRICHKKFSKVVIGSPDPDKRIRGEVFELLRVNKIQVVNVPSGLREEIREINRQFITDRTKDDFEDLKVSKV